MDIIPKDRILEHRPDTMEFLRKQYNLEKPGQMKESVKTLRDWVQKQNHFTRKDFDVQYYEMNIIAAKGSLERAKTLLDKMCTMRTLLPQFFGNYNIKTDFGYIIDFVYVFMLPKLTDDHYRVEIIKFSDADPKSFHLMDFFRSTVIHGEYIKGHDYMNGFIVVMDFTEANLMNYLTKLNPIEMRQIMSIFVEGYGMRIKSIHIVTASKMIDAIVAIAKQVLSPKVAGRVHVHKTVEDIYEHIPKSILPKDYGGEERSLRELQAEWIEVLSSDEHLNYMRQMNEARTDETYRQRDKFNEQCAGMPGTFRLLSVD